MTEGKWTRCLTEEYVTMERDSGDGNRLFLPSKAALASPTTDCELSWRLCRLVLLSSEKKLAVLVLF